MELHADAIQGFFNVPVDHLRASKQLLAGIKEHTFLKPRNSTFISPDAGGVARVRKYVNFVRCMLAIIFKYRSSPTVSEVMEFIGNVKGRYAYIIDDMIQSGGTLVGAVSKLIAEGAKQVYIVIIHWDGCDDYLKNMKLLMCSGAVSKFIITDTVPLPPEIRNLPNVVVISVAPLFAEVIKRIYLGDSVSPLYEINGETKSKKKLEKSVPVEIQLKDVIKKYRNIDIDLDEITA